MEDAGVVQVCHVSHVFYLLEFGRVHGEHVLFFEIFALLSVGEEHRVKWCEGCACEQVGKYDQVKV